MRPALALAAPRTRNLQTPNATSHIAKRVSLSLRARWGAMLEVNAQPGRDSLAVHVRRVSMTYGAVHPGSADGLSVADGGRRHPRGAQENSWPI